MAKARRRPGVEDEVPVRLAAPEWLRIAAALERAAGYRNFEQRERARHGAGWIRSKVPANGLATITLTTTFGSWSVVVNACLKVREAWGGSVAAQVSHYVLKQRGRR